MKKQLAIAISTVAVLGSALTTHATIIGGAVTTGTGTFNILTPPLANPHGPPNSVGNNTFQDNNLYGFDEDQNVLVGPGALSVNEIVGGGPGTIAAGTEVASHYVFFDPRPTTSQAGYVDFDAKILAVITSTGNLLASDYLANTGVNYLNPTARGLEAGDSATIDGLLNYRLRVDWTASTPGDYVRVLTEHSPLAAPDAGSTLALFAGSLIVLAGVRHHRRSQ